MEFRIADTFTDSLARLTRDDAKAVKTTAFDLQLNPSNTGHNFHKLDRPRDRNFWSVRVGSDIRLIVHRLPDSMLLCYVDHHDKAYAWAERRKLEVHPRTGAAQFVEVQQRIEALEQSAPVLSPVTVARATSAPGAAPVLANISAETLLGYGVPEDWVAALRAASEDELLVLSERLPAEAAEAVLELATGGTPRMPAPVASGTDPFAHPDAQRRFRVIANVEELARALEFPWDKWTVFLHPDQRALVERDFSGAARVSGSAGTGKTIVALHRAVCLARNHPDARVLLTTFSGALANSLVTKLRRLVSTAPRLAERIDVVALDTISERLCVSHIGSSLDADELFVRGAIQAAATREPGLKFSAAFLWSEWREVVDASQLQTWEDYRDVKRLGRKTRLPETQRAVLWRVFADVRAQLNAAGSCTRATRYAALSDAISGLKRPPFDFVVVDECQDVSVPQLRLLAALGGNRPNALFFAGDLGQRIFQQPFSWKSLGVDVRGRSRTLHVNYRTSHQIRMRANSSLMWRSRTLTAT